jgi:hypothetical protein
VLLRWTTAAASRLHPDPALLHAHRVIRATLLLTTHVEYPFLTLT